MAFSRVGARFLFLAVSLAFCSARPMFWKRATSCSDIVVLEKVGGGEVD